MSPILDRNRHISCLMKFAVSAGGAAGALVAAPLADFFGRKYALATMGFIFLVGAGLQEVPRLGAMYAGRLLAGLAIGSTSMASPTI